MSDDHIPDLTEDEALAQDYVLGTLSYVERRAFEKRLANEPQLQALVDGWQGRLDPLNQAYAPVTPPAHILTSLEARLFGQASSRPSLWQSLGFWRGLSFAASAAVLALGLYVALPQFQTLDTKSTFVAELAGAEKELRLVALFDGASGELRLNRVAGQPADNRDFELWLIPEGAAPISLGVLPQSQTARLTLADDLKAKIGEKAAFAISDEPVGGSPTGQPTGAVLAVGAITKI